MLQKKTMQSKFVVVDQCQDQNLAYLVTPHHFRFLGEILTIPRRGALLGTYQLDGVVHFHRSLHVELKYSDTYYLSQIWLNIDVSMFKKCLYTCNISTSNMNRGSKFFIRSARILGLSHIRNKNFAISGMGRPIDFQIHATGFVLLFVCFYVDGRLESSIDCAVVELKNYLGALRKRQR